MALKAEAAACNDGMVLIGIMSLARKLDLMYIAQYTIDIIGSVLGLQLTIIFNRDYFA